MKELERSWARIAGTTTASVQVRDDLLTRWSEPHRRYHDSAHLNAVLAAIDVLEAEARAPDTVRLAAWFHDAVYDGRPGDDERASAEVARSSLADAGFASSTIDDVVRLVLLTRTHDPARNDADGAVLCDADLAVLGGAPDEYATYAAAVRQDYAHVPDDRFAAGRAEVLDNLLAAEPLYRTRTGRQRWESAARRNVEMELALVRSQM